MPQQNSNLVTDIRTLIGLTGRDYVGQIKLRLRDDEAWKDLLAPSLVTRTEWGLTALYDSLDEQVQRANGDMNTDTNWLRSVYVLMGLVKRRLDGLPEDWAEIGNAAHEASIAGRGSAGSAGSARAARTSTEEWAALVAELAEIVEEFDPDALVGLRVPNQNIDVVDWLAAREAAGL